MTEKLKTAKDESYLDPTNIRGKMQKHLNFEQELKANKNRLDDIKQTGKEIVDSGHYAAEHVRTCTDRTWLNIGGKEDIK